MLWHSGLLVLAVLWVIKCLMQKLSALRKVQFVVKLQCPGGEILWLTPFRALSILLSPWWTRTGSIGALKNKFSIYKKYGSTCLSSVVFWDLAPIFWFADADAIKTITSDRYTFPKDAEAYKSIDIYGASIVGTEGSDWKRHRSVAMSAFNEANNGLVWSESIRAVNEWFNQLDISNARSDSDITVNARSSMIKITLFIISAAGFGRRWSWDADSKEAPPGRRYSFHSALHLVLDGLLLRVAIPELCYKLSQKIYLPYLSPRLKRTSQAFDDLKFHILELVSTARAWVSGGRTSDSDAALVRNLVEANMAQEKDTKTLTDDELLSNSFIFLLAGHETSAHSLSFAIVLLALHPNVQRKLYDEVVEVWPKGNPISGDASCYKDDFPKLIYTSAVFHETLRCFPAEPHLAKLVKADSVLNARRFTPGHDIHGGSKEFSVRVSAGSVVMLDILGVHMNPFHWGENVEDFNPERFIDTDTYRWPRDAFLAFSAGSRSCIGQRFSLTESVCILASIVRRYEILVPHNLQSKPHEQQKKEMLHWTQLVTMTPSHPHVRLRRRS